MKLFKKKKEMINQSEFNPVFGKIKYIYHWWTEELTIIKLWDKEYPMSMRISTVQKDDPINEAQEQACKKLREHIPELQEKIEKILENEFPLPKNLKPTDVFEGGSITFSRNGKCGIMMDIAEKYSNDIDFEEIGVFLDNSFGISLIPDTFLVKSINDFEELFR